VGTKNNLVVRRIIIPLFPVQCPDNMYHMIVYMGRYPLMIAFILKLRKKNFHNLLILNVTLIILQQRQFIYRNPYVKIFAFAFSRFI
jgi:hypothetical protein